MIKTCLNQVGVFSLDPEVNPEVFFKIRINVSCFLKFFYLFFILNLLLYSYYLPWIKIEHACVSVCLHCFLFTVFPCLCLQEPVLSKEQPAFQYSSHVSLQAPSGHMWWERCSTRCICSLNIHIHIHCPVVFKFQPSDPNNQMKENKVWH